MKTSDLQVSYMKVEDIIPYDKNPRYNQRGTKRNGILSMCLMIIGNGI